uniref:Uncharacterized protein n=1 Tax=Tetranychus urticae TaxID=32264 RepID=T1KQK0_TETUR
MAINSSQGIEEQEITIDRLKSLVQLDELPVPEVDLEYLRQSHVTDPSVQLNDADEAPISQLELIPFVDCVSRATGKRFPTIDDVLARLESYTLSEFIDEMFRCLQSKAFPSGFNRNTKSSRLMRALFNSGFRPEETPKEEDPDRENIEIKPSKPGKIEKPEETGKPGKIERPEEPIVIPKPGKERGDGRIEIFFVRLRWVLWQYLRQLKKQGSRTLQAEGRTIFFDKEPIYIKRRNYRLTRLPVVSEIDCLLFDVDCNTLVMDSSAAIPVRIPVRVPLRVPVRVSSHALDHKFIHADHDEDDDEDDDNDLLLSDSENIGELIADGMEDVAKTVYRFSGGFRRVQRHLNRFINSGADLILG